jgi:hypothetical protein
VKPTAHASVAELAATSSRALLYLSFGTGTRRIVVPVTRRIRGLPTPPPSPRSVRPYSPTTHAPPGNKAPAAGLAFGGSARSLSVFQVAPFHTATRAVERGGLGLVAPMARALLDDLAVTSAKPPATGGISSGERWPLVRMTGAVALGKAVQATSGGWFACRAGGQASGGETVHAAVTAATTTIPARRQRLQLGFIGPMLLTFLRRVPGSNVARLHRGDPASSRGWITQTSISAASPSRER